MLAIQTRHSFNPSLLTMFKKRTESTDLLLQEEHAYNEAIHRLIAARTRGERFYKELRVQVISVMHRDINLGKVF